LSTAIVNYNYGGIDDVTNMIQRREDKMSVSKKLQEAVLSKVNKSLFLQ
jgi:hypothetical protein